MPTYVLVDSAQLASSYSELSEAVRRDPNFHVVLAAREYEWTRRKFEFPDLRPVSIPLERIDEEQAYQIARRIFSYGANPAHPTVEALARQMLASTRSKKHPHLLAAMISSTRGKDFTGIIEDMIRDFEKGDDSAVLRYVACGALTYELSIGEVELLPHYVLQRLIAEMIGVKYENREGKERVRAKLTLYGSELIPIQSNANSNLTVYDVRHPDIAHQIVEWYYGGQWGIEVKRPDDLVSDFDDICRADCAAARLNSFHLEKRYAPRFALAWLRSGSEHEWLTAGITAGLLRAVCDRFDESEGGRIGKSAILKVWAAFEARKPHSPAREHLIDKLYSEALDAAPNAASIWVQWADFKGKYDPQGAQDIFKRAWSAENREPHLLYNWAVLEWRRGNLGEREKPADFTARGLFQEGWSKSKDNLEYVLKWSGLEHEQESAGKAIGTGLFSARGIVQQAWNAGLHHLLLVDQWARVEIAKGNIGHPKHPTFPSGRWLLRNGTNWSNEEDRAQEEDQFDEKSLMNVEHVKFWVQSEMDANYIGDWPANEQDVTNPERFTARWILREAWQQPSSGADLIGVWCKLEESHGHIGEDISNPDKYSVRWIYRESYRRFSLLPLRVYAGWLSIEIRNQHIRGDASLFPAEWILQKMCGISPEEKLFWEARIAQAEGNLGNFEDPDDGTARRRFRTLIREYGVITPWFAMMELEAPEHDSNVGKQWSAEWVFDQYKARGGRADTLERWLRRLAEQPDEQPDYNSLRDFRTVD